MDELIMKAARELGIEQHLSVSPYLDSESKTVVIVMYQGKMVTKGIAPYCLMDTNLAELKKALLGMLEDAKELAKGVPAV
jgi:hypothetical protein